MAKKDIPAEFPTAWHYERHQHDLEQNLVALERRVQELEAMNVSTADIEAAEAAVDVARDQLAHYGWGPKQAALRPKKAAESR